MVPKLETDVSLEMLKMDEGVPAEMRAIREEDVLWGSGFFAKQIFGFLDLGKIFAKPENVVSKIRIFAKSLNLFSNISDKNP